MKKILFVEPYYGGSHREFLDGLKSHSAHDVDCVTLPALNWNWRMNASAVYLALRDIPFHAYDVIITTGMLRLSDLKALSGSDFPPVLVYFHETQLTYPLAQGEKRDPALCMADISTALCADRVLFNSSFHRETFLQSVTQFMDRAPDYPAIGLVERIRNKSGFLYPGMDFHGIDDSVCISDNKRPLVIWNHRWSYDKNAASFFYALETMVKRGVDFELALLGECTEQRLPEIFQRAKERLGDRIVQFGYVQDKKDYFRWLEKGTVVVSTARQENFGMAMVEAMRYGCLPLMPGRLSYPEILPRRFHGHFLYANQAEFLEKMHFMLTEGKAYSHLVNDLALSMETFSWKRLIDDYDLEIERLSSMR